MADKSYMLKSQFFVSDRIFVEHKEILKEGAYREPENDSVYPAERRVW